MRISSAKAIKTEAALEAAGTTEACTAFSDLLQERMEELEEVLKKNEARRQELQELQRGGQITEKIRRMMPDGTIQVTEYEGGRIASCTRQRPRLHLVADESSPLPRDGDGSLLTSLKPTRLTAKWTVADELFQ